MRSSRLGRPVRLVAGEGVSKRAIALGQLLRSAAKLARSSVPQIALFEDLAQEALPLYTDDLVYFAKLAHRLTDAERDAVLESASASPTEIFGASVLQRASALEQTVEGVLKRHHLVDCQNLSIVPGALTELVATAVLPCLAKGQADLEACLGLELTKRVETSDFWKPKFEAWRRDETKRQAAARLRAAFRRQLEHYLQAQEQRRGRRHSGRPAGKASRKNLLHEQSFEDFARYQLGALSPKQIALLLETTGRSIDPDDPTSIKNSYSAAAAACGIALRSS